MYYPTSNQTPNLVQVRQRIKTRFRYQVPNVQQRILNDNLQRLVKSDSAQVHIERSVQSLMKPQLRVVENIELCDIWRIWKNSNAKK